MATLFYSAIIPNIQSGFYQNALLQWAAEHLPDSTLFDWDNLSDSVIMHHAAELLRQSDRVLWVIDVRSPEATVTKLRPFLESFVGHPGAYALRMGDTHPLLERMLTLLPPGRLSHASDLKSAQTILRQVLLA